MIQSNANSGIFLTLSIFSRGLRAVFIEEVKEEGLAKI